MQKKSTFVKQLIKLLLHILGLYITVFGVSLTIKANIGNNAWDAFSLLLSNLPGVKIGYIAMILNGSTIVGQLLIERRDFKKRPYLQVLNVFAAGWIFNFFVYKILGSFVVTDLFSKLITATTGCVIAGLGIAVMAETDFVRNSPEGLCDVIAIGTIISMAVFGVAIDFFRKLIKQLSIDIIVTEGKKGIGTLGDNDIRKNGMCMLAGSTDNPENEQPAKSNPTMFKRDKAPFIVGMRSAVTGRFTVGAALLPRDGKRSLN